MRRLLTVLLAIAAVAPQAHASSFYLTGDVPTVAGGPTRQPWEIVRYDTGLFSVALALPAGTAVQGLHRRDDGQWLFSVGVPTTLGAVDYGPRDIVLFSGAVYSSFFCGASIGADSIPETSKIDALYQDDGNVFTAMISFDVPTTILGITYDPADIVRFQQVAPFNCASWNVAGLAFDASAAAPPIPTSINVVGADRRGAATILTFDVPTTLGATTYLPGDLVAWTPAPPGFSLYESVGGWPANRSSQVNDIAFLPDPGHVPTLSLGKAGGNLTLTWTPSCSVGADDYAIYEGTIGVWYSHMPLVCTDAGANLTETTPMPAGNVYFLVVAENPNDEGYYGDRTVGLIPPGVPTCRPTQSNARCP